MRKDMDRLHDMMEAIDAIERYTQNGREAFDNDELVRVWCLRHLEVIGEASARLSERPCGPGTQRCPGGRLSA